MVMGGDYVLKVVDSNPGAIYWMDIFHINFLQNCIDVCLIKTENKRKRGRGCPIFLKKVFTAIGSDFSRILY